MLISYTVPRDGTCGLWLLLGLLTWISCDTAHAEDGNVDMADHFLTVAVEGDPQRVDRALGEIERNWQPSLVPMAIETALYSGSPRANARLFAMLSQAMGKPASADLNEAYAWLWNQAIEPYGDYATFKANLYGRIDRRFDRYFRGRQDSARIRLDEIRWGGVLQDGIPPLRDPEMVKAKEAIYLADDHIVFGIVVNGDARAYPKRILAWHEMFTDTIGGVPIAGVYCTLCGTVIPYHTRVGDREFELGTSGFLYRSNKLMYDKATQSLWSTERGEPVLGPLVDQGISLPYEGVVTTNWGEWRRRHPDTLVLSIDTGYRRDYGEGVAYANYFATDELMFNTPFNDQRLANKREVLALRFAGAPGEQLAIDTEFLADNPLYTNKIGRQKFLVLTDTSGANRVYDPGDVLFENYDQDSTLVDRDGNRWLLEEEYLSGPQGDRLERLPYHRAFWFGWLAAYPDTQLIQ